MKLFSTLKQTLIIGIIASALLSFTVIRPQHTMFGKDFNTDKDYTCCKNGQLYIHHFYEQKVFWISTDAGYVEEPVGNIDAEGCNIECEN